MSLFKKPKRQFRQREKSSSSEEELDEEPKSVKSLEETKELQRLRKRQKGVTVDDLIAGPKEQESKTKDDPLSRLKTGGFVDLKTLKKEIAASNEEEQIGTTFAAATNRRDEDADMLAYVEKELAKQKGVTDEDKEKDNRVRDPRDALYEMPDHLKDIGKSGKKSEDMLSNQMLSGIPEIDLGIDQKIRNIEQTEEAKQKLMNDRIRARNEADVSNFVPTNMAVNFVQHNRFTVDKSTMQKNKPAPAAAPEPVILRVGDAERPQTVQQETKKRSTGEKASDDFHFEKFRKHMRKY